MIFTIAQRKRVEQAINALGKTLADEMGAQFTARVETKRGNMQVLLEIARVVETDGMTLTAGELEAAQELVVMGFQKEDVKREFICPSGTRYRIVGFNRRATSYPFIAKNLDNDKNYKLPPTLVKRGMTLALDKEKERRARELLTDAGKPGSVLEDSVFGGW
ncbi:MAG: hypothetical protein LPL29_15010 [Alphaproteobacteria bacterium]|nr:hypothetical protein [Alphaproteobacteria bacterium]